MLLQAGQCKQQGWGSAGRLLGTFLQCLPRFPLLLSTIADYLFFVCNGREPFKNEMNFIQCLIQRSNSLISSKLEKCGDIKQRRSHARGQPSRVAGLVFGGAQVILEVKGTIKASSTPSGVRGDPAWTRQRGDGTPWRCPMPHPISELLLSTPSPTPQAGGTRSCGSALRVFWCLAR